MDGFFWSVGIHRFLEEGVSEISKEIHKGPLEGAGDGGKEMRVIYTSLNTSIMKTEVFRRLGKENHHPLMQKRQEHTR